MISRVSFPTCIACLISGILLVGSSLSSSLWAQTIATAKAGPPTSSALVALVDVQTVFESHLTFKATMEKLQQELRQAERSIAAQKSQLDDRARQLNTLNPSSDAYMRLESQIAQQMADLQVQARQTKKQLLQREALQYYTAYNEIVSAVGRVAEQRGISLVLRFDSMAIDPSQPQTVTHGMSRTIVVHHNLDITQHVVNALQVMLAARDDQENTPRR